MAFSDETIKAKLKSTGGQCECRRASHTAHIGRCPKKDFTKENRGTKWESHHKVSIDAGGTDAEDNCEILCLSCHSLIPK